MKGESKKRSGICPCKSMMSATWSCRKVLRPPKTHLPRMKSCLRLRRRVCSFLSRRASERAKGTTIVRKVFQGMRRRNSRLKQGLFSCARKLLHLCLRASEAMIKTPSVMSRSLQRTWSRASLLDDNFSNKSVSLPPIPRLILPRVKIL